MNVLSAATKTRPILSESILLNAKPIRRPSRIASSRPAVSSFSRADFSSSSNRGAGSAFSRVPRPTDNRRASLSEVSGRSEASTSTSAASSSTTQVPTNAEDNASEATPLSILPRPLGVSRRPSTKQTTWVEEMLDQNTRMENRRVLIKEATQGYFHDYNRLDKYEGKTWIGPKSLIREDQALYFPDIEGQRLTPKESTHTSELCAGKISLVSFLTTQSSEEHIKSLTKQTLELLGDHPDFQFVQINLQENPLKSMLVNLFLSSLRRTIPPHLHSTYLISTQNMEMLREDMGMENKHVGYVYLVDRNLKVRWAGCGSAAPGEAEALERCTDVLLKRTSANGSKGSGPKGKA